jgi:hypothetical protein
MRTIVSPGGSIVSWLPELGSSTCASLAFTCPGAGMGMVAVPVTLGSAAEMLASGVSCIPLATPFSALPCCCSGIGQLLSGWAVG